MMRNSKLVIAVLAAFFMMSTVFIGASWDSSHVTALNLQDDRSTIASASSIVIDGTLSTDEWSTAQHKVQWYMDADPENSDGFNYMYVDEDPYNLYIALDLCSDQTNDENGEWVGLWLNTNATVVSSDLEWESELNEGMESLLHDVDNDETIEFFTNDPPMSPYFLIPDEWIAVNGTVEGDFSDIEYDDNVYLNMTSEFNGTHYVTRLDIDVNLEDFFFIFKDLYVENMLRVAYWNRLQNNVTIDEHFLSVSDDLGNLNPDIKIPMGTGTSEIYDVFNIFKENFTSEDTLRLSLNGVNDAPFNTSYDFFNMHGYSNETTFIASRTAYPYATIRNYDIAWAFGPSENNVSDHRSFEIKIPKSELEGYEMDTDLGIIAGGYGTLISWPNTHNWVYAETTLTGIPETDSTEYNSFSMSMKGWTPPSAPILEAISSPDPDGNVLVNWNDDVEVENWTIYRHSSEITKLNVESATAIASGLTESQFNDTGLSDGTYWYAVAAIDSFGYSHLSSSMSVTVELPATTTTTTTTTTTSTIPPIDQQLILIIGGAGAVAILVIVIVILRKR